MKKYLLLACIGLAVSTMCSAQKSENTPPPPPPPEPPKVQLKEFKPPRIVKDEAHEAFLSRNKEVTRLLWKDGQQVTVVRKDNKNEKYNLGNEADKQKFVAKYGEPPVAPPPPPPAPPAPPKKKASKS